MQCVKRWVSILLVLSLSLVLLCSFAGANTYASDYLAQYGAALIATETKGKYDIYYDVTATRTSDTIGVSKIKIYKSDGTYVTTITGTTSNGLLIEQDFVHAGVYTRYGVSGTSYYAEVTFFAERGGGSDSKTVKTNTITVK